MHSSVAARHIAAGALDSVICIQHLKSSNCMGFSNLERKQKTINKGTMRFVGVVHQLAADAVGGRNGRGRDK
jgi:hypothetical protein